MSAQQRYVSSELTHFVGGSLPDEDSQFRLLTEVLRTGLLKSPGKSDVVVEEGVEGGTRTTIKRRSSVQHGKLVSTNEKYSASIVCFADIPVEDLSQHMLKYSRFGLSFFKSFLLGAGANPVFYVARQSASGVRNPLANNPENFEQVKAISRRNRNRGHWEDFTRAELFDAAEPPLTELVGNATTDPPGSAEPSAENTIVREFLSDNLFQFLKFFDPELPEDHVDNYYMEREWRVVGPVQFALKDVARIIVPPAYAQRFRKEFPDYAGQVTFAGE